MPHHLQAVSTNGSGFGPEHEPEDLDDLQPLVRPTWWRWVAIAVIVAMVLAGPLAVAVYRLLS
ncbi:MAG TPA: hypothetical protein VF129_00360 [Actinomycetota bacterium]